MKHQQKNIRKTIEHKGCKMIEFFLMKKRRFFETEKKHPKVRSKMNKKTKWKKQSENERAGQPTTDSESSAPPV